MAFDIQGHRGARGHLPENTLPAFRLALGMGVDTLELDTGVTRDGVVVVHHDRRLNPDVARGADGQWVQAPVPTIFSMVFLRYKPMTSAAFVLGANTPSAFRSRSRWMAPGFQSSRMCSP